MSQMQSDPCGMSCLNGGGFGGQSSELQACLIFEPGYDDLSLALRDISDDLVPRQAKVTRR